MIDFIGSAERMRTFGPRTTNLGVRSSKSLRARQLNQHLTSIFRIGANLQFATRVHTPVHNRRFPYSIEALLQTSIFDPRLNAFLSNIAHKDAPLLCLTFPSPRRASPAWSTWSSSLAVVGYNEKKKSLFRQVEALSMRRDDSCDIDIALNKEHLILRDGTPVLIRQLVAEDAAFIPIFSAT